MLRQIVSVDKEKLTKRLMSSASLSDRAFSPFIAVLLHHTVAVYFTWIRTYADVPCIRMCPHMFARLCGTYRTLQYGIVRTLYVADTHDTARCLNGPLRV